MTDKVSEEHTNLIKSRQGPRQNHFNKGYLLALLLTVSLGTIQFGYSIGSWNTTFDAYRDVNEWGDQSSSKQSVV